MGSHTFSNRRRGSRPALSHPDMRDALGTLVSEFLAREQAHMASLWLIGRGVLQVRKADNGLSHITWQDARDGQTVGHTESHIVDGIAATFPATMTATLSIGVPVEDSMRIELPWGPTSLGVLHIVWKTAAGSTFARCLGLARECSLVVKRHELRDWSVQRFGHELLMGGTSRAWRDVELFIERAAWADSPVLLRGPFGTEKPLVAAAIHATGPERDKAFVEVTCSILDESEIMTKLPHWFASASNGTLFINGLDEVSLSVQQALLHLFGSRVGQWLARMNVDASPRLIAAITTSDPDRICRPLMAELDVLTVDLPSLHDRAEDIPSLVHGILERQGFAAELKVTQALLDFCEMYEWPENRFELERMITRLAVMTHDRPIGADDIHAYTRKFDGSYADVTGRVEAPHLARASTGPSHVPVSSAPMETFAQAKPPARKTSPETGAEWARRVVEEDLSESENLHEGVQRTLRFLLGQYQEQITLGQVARQAGVSPSHLTHLFKSQLGMTFKPFVHHVRIERAKQLLESDRQMRITDIAFEVGFNDLRHFEKLFRRIMAITPSEYRARCHAEHEHED